METSTSMEKPKEHKLNDFFLRPSSFFATLRYKPTWGAVFLLYVLSLVWVAYGMLPYATRLSEEGNLEGMEAIKGLESILGAVTVGASVLTGTFSLFSGAMFIFIVLKLSGFNNTYRESFSLYVWAKVPTLLYSCAAGFLFVLRSESLPSPVTFAILSGIFGIWSTFLLWTGIRSMTNMKQLGTTLIGIGLLLLWAFSTFSGYSQMSRLIG